MFFLSQSTIWSFSFFFLVTYIVLFFSIILYLIPLSSNLSNLHTATRVKNDFYFISCSEALSFFFIPVFLIFYINFLFSATEISAWFGHLIFCSFQQKMVYLVSGFFLFAMVLFASVFYFSSNEIYDFIITKYNMYYWVLFIFLSNSLFTVIFIIEVLSTLIFLLITTSVFSTTFFYKNVNFDQKIFTKNNMPSTFLQSLLFFFWVSLIASLNLFVFLILLYTNLFTFDYFLIEHIIAHTLRVTSLKNIMLLGITWFVILLSIFLKCGVVPFFIWKPTFFKGLNLNVLIFYIIFFYFFLFLFFINFLTIYFNFIFYYYSFVMILFVFLGLLCLLCILCEAFYIKIFFAVSSILNSLLIFLSLVTFHTLDFFFMI